MITPTGLGLITDLLQQHINSIAKACAKWEPAQVAYALATAWHETSAFGRFDENLTYSSADRIMAVFGRYFPGGRAEAERYVRRPDALANKVYGGRLGNIGVSDGWLYRGRGYVQITGRENYARFGQRLNLDLIDKPALASNPLTMPMILELGMREGLFTGKRIADFVAGTKCDFFHARRVINGHDRAAEIAEIADLFLRAIREAACAS